MAKFWLVKGNSSKKLVILKIITFLGMITIFGHDCYLCTMALAVQ